MLKCRGKEIQTGRWVNGYYINENKIQDDYFGSVHEIVPGSLGIAMAISGGGVPFEEATVVADGDPFEVELFTGDLVRIREDLKEREELYLVGFGKYVDQHWESNTREQFGPYIQDESGNTYGLELGVEYVLAGNLTDRPELWGK